MCQSKICKQTETALLKANSQMHLSFVAYFSMTQTHPYISTCKRKPQSSYNCLKEHFLLRSRWDHS